MAKVPKSGPVPKKSSASASSQGVPVGPPRLEPDEIDMALRSRPEWAEVGGSIQRTFGFKNFIEAMLFVDKVADAAESAQHHPDILIRYNKVTMSLNTHDSGGITHKDFELASQMDGLFDALSSVKPAAATAS